VVGLTEPHELFEKERKLRFRYATAGIFYFDECPLSCFRFPRRRRNTMEPLRVNRSAQAFDARCYSGDSAP